MKSPKVVFFKDSDRKWRWKLVAANGRKLCTPGESFSSKRAAEVNYSTVVCTLNENPREVTQP